VAALALLVEGVLVVAERLLDPMRGRRRSSEPEAGAQSRSSTPRGFDEKVTSARTAS
jgi:osmoprotectant transport system permease protein